MNNKFYGKILAKAVDNHNIPSMIDIKNSEDRKSTRLNSSHANISYAVFCLKKKKIILLSTMFSIIIYQFVILFFFSHVLSIYILPLSILKHSISTSIYI